MSHTSRMIAAACLAALLAAGGPAWAAGGGGGGSSGGSSGGGGGGSASAGSDGDFERAERMVRVGAYREAIGLFEEILRTEPANADVLNYLGYSHRKLGETDEALDYYLAALKSEPEHVGANEYLGELYLEMGDIPRAEERLSVLQRACGGCNEQDELARKIAIFKGS